MILWQVVLQDRQQALRWRCLYQRLKGLICREAHLRGTWG